MKRRLLVLAAALLLSAGIGSAVVYHKVFEWKRFSVVEPGVLYRSGQLKTWQLRQAIKELGVKSVFSFTFSDNDSEQEICKELGVRRFFYYLPGDGVGPDDPYLKFLEAVRDPANLPMLVHCSAGVQRTGGAVTLYRTVLQERRFEDAVREMVDRGNEGRPEQIDQLRRIVESLRWPESTKGNKEVSVGSGETAEELVR